MATLLRVHGVIRLPHVISECDGAGRDLGLKKSVLGTGCMVKRSLPGASQCLDNIGRLRPQAGGDCNSGVGEIPKSFQYFQVRPSLLGVPWLRRMFGAAAASDVTRCEELQRGVSHEALDWGPGQG